PAKSARIRNELDAGDRKIVVLGSPTALESARFIGAFDRNPGNDGKRPIAVIALRDRSLEQALRSDPSFKDRKIVVREPGEVGTRFPSMGDADVLIVKTQGELADIYGAADIAVVGNDHNTLEPA